MKKFEILSKSAIRTVAGILAMSGFGCAGILAQPSVSYNYGYGAAASDVPSGADAEVLTRGPVHEAFAEPGQYNASEAIVVTERPPQNIQEIPPDQRPDGESVSWIPGYWSWDSERGDYIWVSGIWRDPPPGRSWVPGYWNSNGPGWNWTSGFWMSADNDELEYLPQPPASLEAGPSSPSQYPDQLWSPGSWIWVNSDYAWRPGTWVSARPDWVWQPAHYVWTRRGYVYVEGYWDRALDRRGVLFAPVYLQHSVYSRPDYAYSPSIVIQVGFLTAGLFISPNSRHYYFGDYYDQRYLQEGYQPWFAVDRNHRDYDPIFSHQRWQYARTDPQWERNVRSDYDVRRSNVEARPARTYSAQASQAARAPERDRRTMLVAAPLVDVAARRDAPIRYQKIDTKQRDSLGGQARDVVKYSDERAKWESNADVPAPNKSDSQARQSQVLTVTREGSGDASGPAGRGRGNSGVRSNAQPMKSVDASPPARAQAADANPGRQQASEQSRKVKIPRSPVSGRRGGASDQADSPPSQPDLGKPDPAADPQSDQRGRGNQPSRDASPGNSGNSNGRGGGNRSNRGQ